MSRHADLSASLAENRKAMAQAALDLQYAQDPELYQGHGPAQRAKSLEDAENTLAFLAEAASHESPVLFADYIAWLKSVLLACQVPERVLADHLVCLQSVLKAGLDPEAFTLVEPSLLAAQQRLPEAPAAPDSFLTTPGSLATLANLYLDALLKGDRRIARDLVMGSMKAGAEVKSLYRQVFEPCQRELGRLWQLNRITVAQEHFCTAVTQSLMSELYPQMFRRPGIGKRAVAACASGDLHELGIRMVADFLEMEGWDTYYLGANMPESSLLAALEDQQADLLALSATITYHVEHLAQVISAVRARPELKRVKILVGGRPFNLSADLWHRIGADGTAPSADAALQAVHTLVGREGHA